MNNANSAWYLEGDFRAEKRIQLFSIVSCIVGPFAANLSLFYCSGKKKPIVWRIVKIISFWIRKNSMSFFSNVFKSLFSGIRPKWQKCCKRLGVKFSVRIKRPKKQTDKSICSVAQKVEEIPGQYLVYHWSSKVRFKNFHLRPSMAKLIWLPWFRKRKFTDC